MIVAHEQAVPAPFPAHPGYTTPALHPSPHPKPYPPFTNSTPPYPPHIYWQSTQYGHNDHATPTPYYRDRGDVVVVKDDSRARPTTAPRRTYHRRHGTKASGVPIMAPPPTTQICAEQNYTTTNKTNQTRRSKPTSSCCRLLYTHRTKPKNIPQQRAFQITSITHSTSHLKHTCTTIQPSLPTYIKSPTLHTKTALKLYSQHLHTRAQ